MTNPKEQLRNLDVNRNVLRTLEFTYGNKSFDPTSSKSKDFYALLIQKKARQSRGFSKLMSAFSLTEDEIRKAFTLIKAVVLETFVQCFQFKLLNDILFLNSRLAKIGIIHTDLCTFFQVSSETVQHFFFQCTYSTDFWPKFEHYWLAVTKKQMKLEYKHIILGILDEKSDLLNYLII